MNIQIYNKNFDLTDSFKQYLEEKFDALDRFEEEVQSCKVELSRDQHHNKGDVYTIEVHILIPHKHDFVIKESGSDARAVVDSIQDKVARQLNKHKDMHDAMKRKDRKLIRALKFWSKDKH